VTSNSPRPAAGGGRWIDVPPERLSRWLDGFADRHGSFTVSTGAPGQAVKATATDGAVAEFHPPFPPVKLIGPPLTSLIAHARQARRVGVLLVRLGGYAAGVFDGTDLVVSKVGSRLVHARHKNGGSSQARFARRHQNEIRDLTDAAADVAARVLLPHLSELDAMVFGGDRRTLDLVLADRRLAPLSEKAVEQFLTVPDPRKDILVAAPASFRAVRILLTD
jgi:hypothetical protein